VDWRQFAASVVQSLAWPVVVLVVVLVLRRPVTKLVPLLLRLKYRDLELEFAQELETLKATAQIMAPEPSTDEPVSELPEEQRLEALLAASPRSAVGEAWRILESAARTMLEETGDEAAKNIFRPLELSRALVRHGVLHDDYSVVMFDRLRILRNEAAHRDDFAVSEESAREYIELALSLVRKIRSRPR
jgi:hypothetical protein